MDAHSKRPDRAGIAFNDAAHLQEMADYGFDFAMTRDAAEHILQEAEAFVNSLAHLAEEMV